MAKFIIILLIISYTAKAQIITVLSTSKTSAIVSIDRLSQGQEYEIIVRKSTDGYTFSTNAKNSIYKKVILVSVDGLLSNAIKDNLQSLPAFQFLKRNGISTYQAHTDLYSTETLPNHVGMVTGKFSRGDYAHGWIKNGNPGNEFVRNDVKSIFDLIPNNALFSTKPKIRKLFGNSFPLKINYQGTQTQNTDSLISILRNVDFAMIHYGKTDSIGHKTSFNNRSGSKYMKALYEIDAFILKIINSMADNSIIIVTSDHGGGMPVSNQHYSFSEPLNNTIPIFIYSNRMDRQDLLYFNSNIDRIHSMNLANFILSQMNKINLDNSLVGIKIK